MQPRYQVFLSSTFRDLREERQAALEAILELGHFPAGMEAFPATDATPWELIKSIIQDSDYYVLIVGGKYGSTGPDGVSYTEMEFDLAEELRKPILAFLHGAPDEIPSGKSELDPEARRRLDAFRARVGSRHCKSWTTKENLKAAVLLALVHTIRTKPAYGWVRNEGLENQELLKRLALLQERYDALVDEVEQLRLTATADVDVSQYRGLDSRFPVQLERSADQELLVVEPTLSDFFFGVADNLLVACAEYDIEYPLRLVAVRDLGPEQIDSLVGTRTVKGKVRDRVRDLADRYSMRRESIADVLRQLLAIGLVEPHGKERDQTTRWWALTLRGRSKYLERRALRPADV